MPQVVQDDEVSSHPAITERIAAAGRELASSFADLVQSTPGRPLTPQDLARAVGVNKDLAHRLMSALRKRAPMATVYLMPGPEPLRRFLIAIGKKGARAEHIHRAEVAVCSFDSLIKNAAGDRSGLDAIISASLPDMRARFESTAKQLVFRGMRQLKGVAADVTFFTAILHPSLAGQRHALVMLRGYLGLHRVRPGATFKMGVVSGGNDPIAKPFTLAREPIGDPRGVLLTAFCSGPPVELHVHTKAQDLVYALCWGDSVGRNSVRDLVMAELRPDAMRQHRSSEDPRPKAGLTNAIAVPTRRYIFDLILHAEAYPGWAPTARILETGELGSADPNDMTRDLDVLDVAERVDPMGWGIERFRAEEIPRYLELLQYVCDNLHWDPQRFRGYRVRIEYPIFGSQVQVAFDVPVASAPAEAT